MKPLNLLAKGVAILMTLGLAVPTGPLAAQETDITPLHPDLAARTYQAACAACHYRGGGKADFGTRGPPGNESPDELLQFILFGKAPERDEGGMPAFGTVLSDADVIRLTIWMRAASKPDAPWTDVPASVIRLRATGQRED